MRINFEKQIAAPVATVWTFDDDDTKIPLWITGSVDISYPDGQDRAKLVGTRFRQTLKEGGREKTCDGRMTAYEPERLLGVRLSDGSFGVDVTYKLLPSSQGTRLDYTADISLQSFFTKLLGFLFKPLTVSIMKRHMANLKRVAEQEAADV